MKLSIIMSTIRNLLPVSKRTEKRSLSRPSRYLGLFLYYGLIGLGFAILIAPILIVIGISFSPTSSQMFPPSGFSLQWYAEFFDSTFFRPFLVVSLPVAFAVGILSTILGLLASYVVVRKDLPFEGGLTMYFLLPLIVPPAIIGLALMLMFNLNIFDFTSAFVDLIIAHVVITIPYTFLTTMTSLYSVDTELEEAARNLGAGKFETFRKVTLPLMKSGVVSGFILAFILSFTDATVALFLTGGDTITLPVAMFLFLQYESSPLIAATATLQILIVLILVLVIGRLVGFKAVTADV
ncbi:ABC transporter permease [Halorubrum vacuolatum]|uniref:Putative spermidine/putrescine transport system permease protein n=1 Tax=Halorubrum vacuolatum TaxID=63740 RepID=A0A238Y750_HALVU|nr:ABC transporter permease [Halorubrum vacuolatum]SNR66782.1 putative spermidine/putrescine transport system permease protein [Halorubrum vacuolatum]